MYYALYMYCKSVGKVELYRFIHLKKRMAENMEYFGGWIIVLVTASNKDEARKIAKTLVEKRLATCVNIVEKVDSMYWWKSKVEEATESLLVIKTKQHLFKELIHVIKENHSYSVPEIIAIPILMGSSEYMKWFDENVKQ